MSKPKWPKRLLILTLVLVVLQIPWFITVQIIVDNTLVKTTATVIQIKKYSSGCKPIDYQGCKPSVILAPVFEYKDKAGQTYTEGDQYLDGYKQNSNVEKVFGKKIGDRVTAYYSKGSPKKATFMAGPYVYSVWLIPIYIAVPIGLLGGLIYIFTRRGSKLS